MEKEILKLYNLPTNNYNKIMEIKNQLQEIFKEFQYNNEKDCVDIIINEEFYWNTMIDVTKEIKVHIVHKTMFTSNILLLENGWYIWEMPLANFRFNKKHINQFKKDYPHWKKTKYLNFSKALKEFIIEKWNLIWNKDLMSGIIGFRILTKLWEDFDLSFIPAIKYYHFDKYPLRGQKKYIEGIFFRRATRDFFARFPQRDIKNINQKDSLTNGNFSKTARLIKWLYYSMNLDNNFSLERIYQLNENDYHFFDYMLYNIYYKYFLEENLLERCINIIFEILSKINIKFENLTLPNHLMAIWQLDEKYMEDFEYGLEKLVTYLKKDITIFEDLEFKQEAKEFVEYMEDLTIFSKKH